VIRRRNRGLFVPIDRIIPVEELDFLIDLLRRERIAPEVEELFPHPPRPELVDFAEAAVDGELVVGHTHVDLIGLDVVVCNGLEL